MPGMPASTPTLLFMDAESLSHGTYMQWLRQAGYQVETALNAADAIAQLECFVFDVVLCTMRAPSSESLAVLHWLQAHQRNDHCIVLSSSSSPAYKSAAAQAGAADFWPLPVNTAQLLTALKTATGSAYLAHKDGEKKAAPQFISQPGGAAHPALAQLMGESLAMRRVRQQIIELTHSTAPVLIVGETGTGKKQAAQALHAAGLNAQGPWVAVDCSALPISCVEEAFFGTPCQPPHTPGFLESARGGTLLLENIQCLPVNLQIRLLHVLQTLSFPAPNSARPAHLHARIICTTPMVLANQVMQGWFHPDLLSHLSAHELRMPALRDRREDLPHICQVVMEQIAQEHGLQLDHVPAAWVQALMQMPLFSNLQELHQHLRRAMSVDTSWAFPASSASVSTAPVSPQSVAPQLHSASCEVAVTADHPPDRMPLQEQTCLAPRVQHRHVKGDALHDSGLPADLPRWLDDQERRILQHALRLHDYNRSAAAARLGISLRQMRYRIERLQIPVEPDNAGPLNHDI